MPHRSIIIAAPLACVFLIAGCGRKPAPEASSSTPAPGDAPAVTQPSLPQPLTDSRKLYITESFQTESVEGIHDFPKGAEVELIGIIEEDYVVQRNGVSVRISRTFFSETPVPMETAGGVTPPEPSPSPSPDAALPAAADTIPGEPPVLEPVTGPAAPSAPVAAPALSEPAPLEEDPAPALSAEDRKIEELTESIRDLNERIRSVRQTLAGGTNQPDPGEVRKLQKERDQLSKELTGLVKP